MNREFETLVFDVANGGKVYIDALCDQSYAHDDSSGIRSDGSDDIWSDDSSHEGADKAQEDAHAGYYEPRSRPDRFKSDAYVQVGGAKDDQSRSLIDKGAQALEKGAAKVKEFTKDKFEDTIKMITPIANVLVRAINDVSVKPDEFEVTFNLAIKGELAIKIVKIDSEADMKVRLTWKGASQSNGA